MYSPAEIRRLADWAAQECTWQMSGEWSVARLIDAALLALNWANPSSGVTTTFEGEIRSIYPSEHHIRRLGQIVDPRNDDFRTRQVWVGDNEMSSWERIPDFVAGWVEGVPKMDPTEAFKTFEQIHPFIDGNGRVGAILYNWLNKTLHPGELQFPPNVFADSRREGITL